MFDDFPEIAEGAEKVLTQIVILVDAITLLVYVFRGYVKKKIKRELDNEQKNGR